MIVLSPDRDALLAAFAERLRRVHEALVESSERPSERVSHRLRTSTRRLEATLSLLPRRLRTRGPLAEYVAAAKAPFRAHGRARDLDVLAGRLSVYPECAALLGVVRAERAAARAEARATTVAMAAEPPPLDPEAIGASKLRRRTRKRFRALCERLDRDLRIAMRRPRDDERAHDARKVAKQLRYVLEAVDERGFATALAAMQALQDHLGAMHDAAVARDRVRAAGDPSLEPAALGEERARLALHAAIAQKYGAVRRALDEISTVDVDADA